MQQTRTFTLPLSVFYRGEGTRPTVVNAAKEVVKFCARIGEIAHRFGREAVDYLGSSGNSTADGVYSVGKRDVRGLYNFVSEKRKDADGSNAADCARYTLLLAAASLLSKEKYVAQARSFLDGSDDPYFDACSALGHAEHELVDRCRSSNSTTYNGTRATLVGLLRKAPEPGAAPVTAETMAIAASDLYTRARIGLMRLKKEAASTADSARTKVLKKKVNGKRAYFRAIRSALHDPDVRSALSAVSGISRESCKSLNATLKQLKRYRSGKGRKRAAWVAYGIMSCALARDPAFSPACVRDGLVPGLVGLPFMRGPRPVAVDLTPVRYKYVFNRPEDMETALNNGDALGLGPGEVPVPVGPGIFFIRGSKVGKKIDLSKHLFVTRPTYGLLRLLSSGVGLKTNAADVRIPVPSHRNGSYNPTIQILIKQELPAPVGRGTGVVLSFDLNRLGKYGAVGAVRRPDEDIFPIRNDFEFVLKMSGHKRHLEVLDAEKALNQQKRDALVRELRRKRHSTYVADIIGRKRRRIEETIAGIDGKIGKTKEAYDLEMADYIYGLCDAFDADEIVFENAEFINRHLRKKLAKTVQYMAKPEKLTEIIKRKAGRNGHDLKIVTGEARNTSRWCHRCLLSTGKKIRVRRRGDRYVCPECGSRGNVHEMAACNILLLYLVAKGVIILPKYRRSRLAAAGAVPSVPNGAHSPVPPISFHPWQEFIPSRRRHPSSGRPDVGTSVSAAVQP